MSNFRYPQPANEYDFLDFCLIVMRHRLKIPTLEEYGHRGERQHGVDIYDCSGVENADAIQCKHHLQHKTISPAELAAEVEKAKSFPGGSIGTFWIFTSAKRSAAVQNRLALINREHAKNGLFQVRIMFWDDIERIIDNCPEAKEWLGLKRSDGGRTPFQSESLAMQVVTSVVTLANADLDDVSRQISSGKLVEATFVLDRVRSRDWGTLSPGHKSRWLSLRAEILFRQNKSEDAARLLLDAYDHCPDDCASMCNCALGRLILGEPSANDLASVAIEKYPSSGDSWSIGIMTAPDEASLNRLVSEIPLFLRTEPEIQRSISLRPELSAEFPLALDRYLETRPDDPWMWLIKGDRLLSVESHKVDDDSWEIEPIDRDKIGQAVDAFSRAIELATQQGFPAILTNSYLHRASCRELLHEREAARFDIELATKESSSDPYVCLARAKILLNDGAIPSAISILGSISPSGCREDVRLILASALLRMSDPGRQSEAEQILWQIVEGFDAGGDASLMLMSRLLNIGDVSKAEELVERSERASGPIVHSILRARLLDSKGLQNEARGEAVKCIGLLDHDSTRRDFQRVGALLLQLEMYQESLPIFRRLAERQSDQQSVQAYVGISSRLGLDGEALKACTRNRLAGFSNRELLNEELRLLDKYDPTQEMDLLEEQLAKNKGDQFLRFHLVMVAGRMKRVDILRREVDSLPSVEQLDSVRAGVVVVEVLKALGRSLDAVSYSYELLRRYFEEADAHYAFIWAVIERDKSSVDIELAPIVAEICPGMAVRLIEGNRDERWVVLEDSPNRSYGVPDEVDPSTKPWSGLLGLKEGDFLELTVGPGLSRKARVAKFESKITFRLNECMRSWQWRFPNDQRMWMGNAGNEEDLRVSLGPILDANRKKQEELVQIYRDNPVPISWLGKELGQSAYSMTLNACRSPDLPIRCCLGTSQEHSESYQALDQAEQIVLDATAVATLRCLGLLDVLDVVGKPLLSTNLVLRSVEEFEDKNQFLYRVAGVVGDIDGERVLRALDHGAPKAGVPPLATDIYGQVSRFLNLCGATDLADIEPQMRKKIESVMDSSTAESMAVGSVDGRILWTDDIAVGHIVRADLGGGYVWTQLVLEWLLDAGVIDETIFLNATAKLVECGYSFVLLTPRAVLHSAQMSSWDVDSNPLSAVLGRIVGDGYPLQSSVVLALSLVSVSYVENRVGQKADAILFRVCDGLRARKDGASATRLFAVAMPAAFGVDVIGLGRAMNALRAWVESTKKLK